MTDSDIQVSKTQRKRAAHAVLELAVTLVNLASARRARLQLPERVAIQLDKTRGITARVARKRETQYLAKLIRDADCADDVHGQLIEPAAQSRQRVQRSAVLETWASRLQSEGDALLAELLDACPAADRQRLRQLIRNAGKAPKHRARLLAELNQLDQGQPLPPLAPASDSGA